MIDELQVKIKDDDTLWLDQDGVSGYYTGGKRVGVCGRWIESIAETELTRTIEAHASDDTLTDAESGSLHTSLGATGTITLTLPESPEGCVWFTFAVQAQQNLRIDPGPNSTILLYGDIYYPPEVGGYIYANAIGEAITLVANGEGDWVTIDRSGTWIHESY